MGSTLPTLEPEKLAGWETEERKRLGTYPSVRFVEEVSLTYFMFSFGSTALPFIELSNSM